jgi:hypothetical protein
MSDYSQLTFFAPKDALSSGNPAKLIKGAEVDPELAAISTAVSSKFDSTDIATNVETAAMITDTKLLTPAKLLYALTNGTFTSATGFVVNLVEDGSPNSAADFLLTFDASAGTLKKALIGNVVAAVGFVPTTRSVIAGAGLTGGGDFTADRTISVGAGGGIVVNADDVGLDLTNTRNLDHAILGVTAGSGLTGGGDATALRAIAVDRSGTDGTQTGYLDVPQNAQSGSYTLTLADRGKHIYHASGAGASDLYQIPANSAVAFPLGSTMTFINSDSNAVSIGITTDTMTLAGTTTTGTRTLAQNGMATVIKVTSTSWIISGSGLT